MSFIDVIYQPLNTGVGALVVSMEGELPALTSQPDVIMANLYTVAGATIQGELPQNTLFGVPAQDQVNVIKADIAISRSAKAFIAQKMRQDVQGTLNGNPTLATFLERVQAQTTITGGI